MNPHQPSERCVFACHYANRITFLLSRLPSFKEEYIEKLASDELDESSPSYVGTRRRFAPTLGGARKEIDQFKHNSVNNARLLSLFLIILYLSHLVKDMLVQMVDYNLVNRRNLESNLVRTIQAHNVGPSLSSANPSSHSATKQIPEPLSVSEASPNSSSLVVVSQFSCLATNCTRLSADDTPLLLDLSKLPYFKLCTPNLSKYYNYINIVDPLALLTFTSIAFGVVLLATMLPVWHLLAPFPHLTLMFVIAPKAVTNALHVHLRHLLDDLNGSWANFVLNTSSNSSMGIINTPSSSTYVDRLLGTCCAQRRLDNYKEEFIRRCSLLMDQKLALNELTATKNGNGNDDDVANQQLRNKAPQGRRRVRLEQGYLDDCLPAIRTEWWRTLLSRMYVNSFLLNAFVIFTTFFGVLHFLVHRAEKMQDLYKSFANQVDHMGCKLWLAATRGYKPQAVGSDDYDRDRLIVVDLHHLLNADYSVVDVVDRVASNLIVFTIVMIFTYYWIEQMELWCWLYEVRNSCQCMVKLLHNIDERHNVNFGHNFSNDGPKLIKRIPELDCDDNLNDESLSSISIKITRNKFMQASNLGLLFTSNLSHETQLEITDTIESLVDESAENVDDMIKFQYETLEKCYLNLRLFLIYINEQNQILSVVAAISYPLNYGMAIICITHVRQTNSFGVEPVILMAAGMLIANFLILIPSSFNAKVS